MKKWPIHICSQLVNLAIRKVNLIIITCGKSKYLDVKFVAKHYIEQAFLLAKKANLNQILKKVGGWGGG